MTNPSRAICHFLFHICHLPQTPDNSPDDHLLIVPAFCASQRTVSSSRQDRLNFQEPRNVANLKPICPSQMCNMQTVRAEYDPDYFKRFLWLSLGCLFFGSWFLFDGLVGYPAELKRCEAYWQESQDPRKPPGSYEPIDKAAWEKICAENNWSKTPPKTKPDKQAGKIGTQFFYSVLCYLITIPCLLKWYLPRGTWVEGDDKELKSSWGKEFKYSQITQINKKKWEERGIAKIKYDNDGIPYSFTFDDYKYEREAMGKIMIAMEAGLKDDQIIGAERETVRIAKLKEATERSKATAVTQEPDHDDPPTEDVS